MSVTTVSVLRARAGREAEVAEALRAVVGPTLDEPGCVAYEVFRDADDVTAFVVIAEWRSHQALKHHTALKHIARFRTATADLTALVETRVLAPLTA